MEGLKRSLLLEILTGLGHDELQRFKDGLGEVQLKEGQERVPAERLQDASPAQLVDLLISFYGEHEGAEVTAAALRATGQEALAERLMETPQADNDLIHMEEHTFEISNIFSAEKSDYTCLLLPMMEQRKLIQIADCSVILPDNDLPTRIRACASEMPTILSTEDSGHCLPPPIDVSASEMMSTTDSYKDSVKFQKLVLGNQVCCSPSSHHLGTAAGGPSLSHQLPSHNKAHSPPARKYGNLKLQTSHISHMPTATPFPQHKVPLGLVTWSLVLSSAVRQEDGAGVGSNTGQRRKLMCQLCQTEEDIFEEVMPEIVPGPKRYQHTYRVHFTRTGSYRCSETALGFEVRASVAIEYKWESWKRHLNPHQLQGWDVAGPLFNFQVEPAGAIAAIHLPHVVCLKGGEVDISLMYVAHIVNGELTLEKPTRVKPFYAVLENPSFSCLGLVFRYLFKHIPVHSKVLLYHAAMSAPTTLHVYVIPCDDSLEKAVEEHEEKYNAVLLNKPPQMDEALYVDRNYSVASSPNTEILPKKLKFCYPNQERLQPFIEVYTRDMKMGIKLHITEVSSTEILWETTVRVEDVQRARSSPEEQADLHFIDRQRKQLIQRVTGMDALLDKLYGLLLDEEQYQRIRAEATNQDKMRRLYDLVPSWNRACKDRLYEALKVQHKHLVAELERQ
ncbi:NACHT, LRR and PYD domains-containing protein 1b allele 2-like isoform X3 [Alligator sinensis]|uniref:NACHT, LRR and PYD domains-containing protein 1b allele 2-like isoform X3 n=1 Tax=Alligator sinensis TaxID=38654 RepID=A0A3Q0FRZ2_ALLSI|nr:NACHT, LRR and PYD domains-containing protein 1b allele 2-like isoform X3 [Alligator sinensis]